MFCFYSVDPGASDGDNNEAEGLYSGSQFFTQCSTVSTEPDPTGAGLDLFYFAKKYEAGISGIIVCQPNVPLW